MIPWDDDTPEVGPITVPSWCLWFFGVMLAVAITGGLWLPRIDALLVQLQQMNP